MKMQEKQHEKIALINDLSGFGKCSLTAALPVISVMGIQACPLPTAVLTAQSGFDEYYCDDFTDRMDLFTEQRKKMDVSFDGIFGNRRFVCFGHLRIAGERAEYPESNGKSNLFFTGSN